MKIKIFFILFLRIQFIQAQEVTDSLLTIDRIYNSSEFKQEMQRPVFRIEEGEAFVTVEKDEKEQDQLIKYISRNNKKSTYLSSEEITPPGRDAALQIEDFTLSPDASRLLIFTNSSRVWRSNTKGDYWVYDFKSKKLQQIGKKFPSSSLMFAKISGDYKNVAYVHNFNIYLENFSTGEIIQLTSDGTGDIINGTFDWVYEEEFGARDGFTWSPESDKIAFWQLDATQIGTFYMINNTDSIYSKPIPLQYPKVGDDPSSAKLGVIDIRSKEINWIPVPGDPKQNYLPAMQWVDNNLLLIQQLNRKQNQLNVYKFQPASGSISKLFTET